MKGFRVLVLLLFFVATSCGQQRKYVSYTVKKGETMRTIAQKLNMKTKDLLRLNPDVGRRPSPSTTIIIPNKKMDVTTNTDNVNANTVDEVEKEKDTVTKEEVDLDELRKKFVIHEVKKGDTFYSLTRFYNVSENQLKELNPALSEGLKVDTFIKIKPVKTEAEEDEVLIFRDSIYEDVSVKLAMMLPFRAVAFDTVAAQDIFKSNTLANITTDLYLGAEIAVDSLKKQGLDITLTPFDTGSKNEKLTTIIRENDFDQFDAVVGPLYSEEVPVAANRIRKPIVFPVYSKNQERFSSSRIVKTYPDKEEHFKTLMNYILEQYTNENILIIGDSTATSIAVSNQIQSKLLQHDSIQEAKIIHPDQGYIKKHIIINSLKAEVANWVIFANDNSGLSSDVVNSLISLPQEEEEEEGEEGKDKKEERKKDNDEPEMQILPEDTVRRVFAFDKNDTFDKVDNNKLALLHFTFTSDVFVEEQSPALTSFRAQYMRKNNAYPSYYAIKGFDIVYDIGMRLASGADLKETFNEGSSYRLESKFDYNKKLFSTSSNRGLFLLKYNSDLTITRIK